LNSSREAKDQKRCGEAERRGGKEGRTEGSLLYAPWRGTSKRVAHPGVLRYSSGNTASRAALVDAYLIFSGTREKRGETDGGGAGKEGRRFSMQGPACRRQEKRSVPVGASARHCKSSLTLSTTRAQLQDFTRALDLTIPASSRAQSFNASTFKRKPMSNSAHRLARTTEGESEGAERC